MILVDSMAFTVGNVALGVMLWWPYNINGA
jgi:hypothetical protein